MSPPTKPDSAWTQTKLYLFGTFGEDGVTPYGGVAFGADGGLFGTTNQGGADVPTCAATNGCGTVFELQAHAGDAGWTERVLYRFNDRLDGGYPYAGVIANRTGSLGTPYYGGSQTGPCQSIGGCGTVYQFKPPSAPGGTSSEIVLHQFADGLDGQGPDGGVISWRGSIIGRTAHGGGQCAFAFTCGTVFEVTPRSRTPLW